MFTPDAKRSKAKISNTNKLKIVDNAIDEKRKMTKIKLIRHTSYQQIVKKLSI